jgi:hypothetical protein
MLAILAVALSWTIILPVMVIIYAFGVPSEADKIVKKICDETQQWIVTPEAAQSVALSWDDQAASRISTPKR